MTPSITPSTSATTSASSSVIIPAFDVSVSITFVDVTPNPSGAVLFFLRQALACASGMPVSGVFLTQVTLANGTVASFSRLTEPNAWTGSGTSTITCDQWAAFAIASAAAGTSTGSGRRALAGTGSTGSLVKYDMIVQIPAMTLVSPGTVSDAINDALRVFYSGAATGSTNAVTSAVYLFRIFVALGLEKSTAANLLSSPTATATVSATAAASVAASSASGSPGSSPLATATVTITSTVTGSALASLVLQTPSFTPSAAASKIPGLDAILALLGGAGAGGSAGSGSGSGSGSGASNSTSSAANLGELLGIISTLLPSLVDVNGPSAAVIVRPSNTPSATPSVGWVPPIPAGAAAAGSSGGGGGGAAAAGVIIGLLVCGCGIGVYVWARRRRAAGEEVSAAALKTSIALKFTSALVRVGAASPDRLVKAGAGSATNASSRLKVGPQARPAEGGALSRAASATTLSPLVVRGASTRSALAQKAGLLSNPLLAQQAARLADAVAASGQEGEGDEGGLGLDPDGRRLVAAVRASAGTGADGGAETGMVPDTGTDAAPGAMVENPVGSSRGLGMKKNVRGSNADADASLPLAAMSPEAQKRFAFDPVMASGSAGDRLSKGSTRDLTNEGAGSGGSGFKFGLKLGKSAAPSGADSASAGGKKAATGKGVSAATAAAAAAAAANSGGTVTNPLLPPARGINGAAGPTAPPTLNIRSHSISRMVLSGFAALRGGNNGAGMDSPGGRNSTGAAAPGGAGRAPSAATAAAAAAAAAATSEGTSSPRPTPAKSSVLTANAPSPRPALPTGLSKQAAAALASVPSKGQSTAAAARAKLLGAAAAGAAGGSTNPLLGGGGSGRAAAVAKAQSSSSASASK